MPFAAFVFGVAWIGVCARLGVWMCGVRCARERERARLNIDYYYYCMTHYSRAESFLIGETHAITTSFCYFLRRARANGYSRCYTIFICYTYSAAYA